MDKQFETVPEFYTKLSLPKFISLIRRLSLVQKKLVCSIGLGNLLEINCEALPRGLICYLVSKFDTRSRTLNIPNGPAVVLTAFMIHQVLGTPVGGRKIGERVDQELREHFCGIFGCKGRYPTINELDSLITSDLEGDVFKAAFGMYAMTAFLCPSSHDAVCPDYLHIFKEPDNIGYFDLSGAVLDKLVSSVEAYNDGLTSVLGGNLFSLLIIYLEFKDTDIVPQYLNKKLPRASIWSTTMVINVESMDCISWDSNMYGNLPVKPLADTPFNCNSIGGDVFAKKSYDDLLNFVLSVCPKNKHKEVIEHLFAITSNMQKDIVEATKDLIFENIINVLKIIPPTQLSCQVNEAHSLQTPPQEFKVPLPESFFKQERVGSLIMKSAETTPRVNYDGSNIVSLTKQISDFTIPNTLILPVPDILDDESCRSVNFMCTKSLLDAIDVIPQDLGFDVPYPHSLLESLNPEKDEISYGEGGVPTVLDLVSYIMQEIEGDARVRKLMSQKLCTVDEKADVFNELFIIAQRQVGCKEKKTSYWLSTRSESVDCIALKKRARMMQMIDPDVSSVQVLKPEEESAAFHYHDYCFSAGHSSTEHSPISIPKEASNDMEMIDDEWEKEFVNSSIKIEEEYYARQSIMTDSTQGPDKFHVSEISPENLISTFSSTIVEQDVFSDIVARIPKTAKSKTIQIAVMGSTWVEHRVFGLSMQVYGKVHTYVMNLLGKAVMVEDVEKKNIGMMLPDQSKRYVFECKIAALFQLEHESPGKLSRFISNGMLGFMLDSMDLIHLPLFTSGFYYLIVVNLKKKMFEVLYPNKKLHLVENEAFVSIRKFKMSFVLAYKNSLTDINAMTTVFRSVCASERDGDSGVFVMKLIRDYDGLKTMCFQPEHAKPLRESLTYYMVAHPFNEKIPAETRKILQKHNIPYDYKTPGYFPWMHELNDENTEDPLELILKF